MLVLLVLVFLGASLSWLQWSSQQGIILGYPMPNVHISTVLNDLTLRQPSMFAANATGRELLYTWDFGDQSGVVNGASVSHAYESNGTFTVTVTVTDRVGHSSYATHTVHVFPPPPTASFSASVSYSGYVSFDASASAADPSTSIATYLWDFGDGNSDSTSYNQDSHSYTNTGTYTVRLLVTDAIGQQSSPYTATVVIS